MAQKGDFGELASREVGRGSVGAQRRGQGQNLGHRGGHELTRARITTRLRAETYWRWSVGVPSGFRPKNSIRPLPFRFASYIAVSASRISCSGWL